MENVLINGNLLASHEERTEMARVGNGAAEPTGERKEGTDGDDAVRLKKTNAWKRSGFP